MQHLFGHATFFNVGKNARVILFFHLSFAIETLTADREKEEETRNRLRTDYEKELNQLRDQLDKASQVSEEFLYFCQ